MRERQLWISDSILERDGADWWKDEEVEDYSCRATATGYEIYDNTYATCDDMNDIYIQTWDELQDGGIYTNVRAL